MSNIKSVGQVSLLAAFGVFACWLGGPTPPPMSVPMQAPLCMEAPSMAMAEGCTTS